MSLAYPGSSPYPIWLSASTTAALFPFAFRSVSLPPPIALFGLSAIYTGIGFLIEKDPVAGCSVASAWGIIHLVGFGKKTIKSRKMLPISHLGIISLVTGIYFKEFIQDF